VVPASVLAETAGALAPTASGSARRI